MTTSNPSATAGVETIEKEKIGIVALSLGIYFLMMPFDSFPMFGMGSLLRLVSLVPIGVILFVKRKVVFYVDSMSLILLVYLTAQAISCIYSRYPGVSVDYLLRLILNFALMLCVGRMYVEYTWKDIQFLKLCLVLGGLATMVMTFLFSDIGAAGRLTIGVNGAVQDQNMLNGYMLFAYTYFFSLLLQKKRVIFGLPLGAIGIFAMLTGSRGAIICLMGVSAVLVLLHMHMEKGDRIGIIILITAVLLLLVMNYDLILSLLPTQVAQRFSITYIRRYGSSGRTMIWRYLLNLYAGSDIFRTFFGYGYAMVAYINRLNHLVSHNTWIEHLLMGGLLGEIIFCIMLTIFGVKAWKTKDRFLIGSYCGFLIMMTTLSLLSYKPVWNCMIMIMIIYQYKRMNDVEDSIEKN